MTKKAFKKADGTPTLKERVHAPELDRATIYYSEDQLEHARGVVAASAKECHGRTETEDAKHLLDVLGLMPEQDHWYHDKANEPRRLPYGGNDGGNT